ncbi:hypothetical protein, partial [Salmonella enterica]|uniref:hypothetical protein n=1 Tax=Salmonella enterica TaxID=28901 RepID=UPI0034D25906
MRNVSAETALIALQGPAAENILSKATSETLGVLPPFHFIQNAQVCGHAALLSRTGYTGEEALKSIAPPGMRRISG